MPLASILLLLIAMLSIQSGAALAKQLFPLVGSMGVTMLRTSLAATLLLAIWRPWKASWTPQQMKLLALYGGALGLMNLFFYLSIQRIPLGIAVALEFTGPLAVALFSSRKILDFVWAGLAGLGIFLILPIHQFSASLDLRGALFALAAGIFWALYIIFGKKAGKGVHGGHSTAIGMLFAALVTLPTGIYESGSRLGLWEIWPLGLGVAVLSSALPYSLEMVSLKRIPIKTFSILMSLEPVVASLAGVLFLQEHLSGAQSLGITSIVMASLGCSLTSNRSQAGYAV